MSPSSGSGSTARSVLSQLTMIVALSAVTGLLVAGLALPFAGALGLGGEALSRSIRNLPEDLDTEPLAQRTRVLDANGKLLATFYDQNRVNVPLDQVAPVMRQALLAIEDSRFYEHGALDVKGTLRAFISNQTNDSIQGGSSITQQMVKMTLLNQARTAEERKAATADTYQRKIQELRHAIAVEQNYSKDWILERYLNIAYFGDGAYGIQSAARHYFSKDADELELTDAALLAGLVKNPYGYDPTNAPERAEARRNTVLNRMVAVGDITADQAEEAKGAPLGLDISPTRNGCVGSKAAFFCDYVRRYLLADPALGETREAREQLLNSGGLTIETTLRMKFQRAADQAVRDAVEATDQAIGAIAMVEPGSGEVLAIAQSRPMGTNRKKGQTFLNYVVDSKYGDSNGFQAGSTFKVFVVAAALEQGLPTSTKFKSPQTISIPQDEFQTCDGPYPVSSPWEPSNSTGSGTFDMYSGTRRSVNTYFAQLEKKTGLCKPYSLARSMGVDLTDPDHERVPSFVLGIADVSPLEMASAYATFGARGLHCDNRPVTEIRNSDGSVFKTYPKKCQQVMQTNTADTVNDILRGVMERGGFGSRLAIDKPSAGKTGTIQNNKAVWFMGYTPVIATAAMIAGANQSGQPITLNGQTVGGSRIGQAFGSTVAGPMWSDAMHAIADELKDVDFVAPFRAPPTPDLVIVPNVVGMSVNDAKSTLRAEGFSVRVRGEIQSDLPKGLVARTSPESGATMYEGSRISLYVSTGPPEPEQPPSPPGDGDGGDDDDDDGGGPGNGNGGGNGGPGNGNGGGGGGPGNGNGGD